MNITPITSIANKNYYTASSKNIYKKTDDCSECCYNAHFYNDFAVMKNHNLTFGADLSKKFFISLVPYINRCAYTGRLLLKPNVAQEAYDALEKRVTAQQAIDYLNQFIRFMCDRDGNNYVEGEVFNLFKSADHRNKKSFQDILLDNRALALFNLKKKQKQVLLSANPWLKFLEPETAQEVEYLRDETLEYMDYNNFSRKAALGKLLGIMNTSTTTDKQVLQGIYRVWYKLPRSAKDLDAFIVKYSQRPHDKICNRLLSPSVATIEHVEPSSSGGDDVIGNWLLACSMINSMRSSIPLDKFILLNDDIEIAENIQQYMYRFIEEINRKKSPCSSIPWYPKELQRHILSATNKQLLIDIDGISYPKKQIEIHDYNFERLSKKYKTKRR